MKYNLPSFLDANWSVLDQLIDELAPTSIFVLTDNNTESHCLPIFKAKFKCPFTHLTMPAGEQYKNLESAEKIWQFLADNGADRQSVLINLGGGVVTDIGAFCAATFMRGIRYIQMPTSVLAMTDAALGGKTGIDLGHLKNYVGTFSQAEGIYIYTDFIDTLPAVEQRNGFGEIIKHAILEGGQLWDIILNKPSLDEMDWVLILKLSIQIKVNIVEQDHGEKGKRKILNLGHTFGHAIESYSLKHDKNPLKHGEAVAQGIIFATHLSVLKIGLSEHHKNQVFDIISFYFEQHTFDKSIWDDLYKIMLKDKKNQNGEIKVILFDKIGQPKWDIGLSKNEYERTMKTLS